MRNGRSGMLDNARATSQPSISGSPRSTIAMSGRSHAAFAMASMIADPRKGWCGAERHVPACPCGGRGAPDRRDLEPLQHAGTSWSQVNRRRQPSSTGTPSIDRTDDHVGGASRRPPGRGCKRVPAPMQGSNGFRWPWRFSISRGRRSASVDTDSRSWRHSSRSRSRSFCARSAWKILSVPPPSWRHGLHLGPAVLAHGLSTVARTRFIPPLYSLTVTADRVPYVVAFVVFGLLMSWLAVSPSCRAIAHRATKQARLGEPRSSSAPMIS